VSSRLRLGALGRNHRAFVLQTREAISADIARRAIGEALSDLLGHARPLRAESDYLPATSSCHLTNDSLAFDLPLKASMCHDGKIQGGIRMPAVIGLLAFFCEFVDSSLGMGYGTTLTPVLLLLGFPANVIVPSILMSELASGLTAAAFHQKCGNVSLERGSKDRAIAILLALTGAIGAVLAVFVALNLPPRALKGYIGTMVLAMGLLVLVFRKHKIRFSWPRILVLGIVSAFNKGISGGGYGPLVVSGQILSGANARNAIAITSLAEGLICLVALVLYLTLNSGAHWLARHWQFYTPMVAGALLAAPAAAYATKAVSRRLDLRLVVGLLTSILGAWTLIKTFG